MPAIPWAEDAGAAPELHRVRAHGIELACFEWRTELRGRGPTLLLVHATGFHARCWDRVVAHLGDHHVMAVDQRSHGRSEKTEIVHWDVFGRDLVDLVRAFDLADVLGVGHSMGGHALVDAAAARSRRDGLLVLADVASATIGPVCRARAGPCPRPGTARA